ncbi:MAG: ATP-binding protein [Deltaproteobacteria bacterium]|nr:ATP-binding protein [Deltaproteobacteria bacterium]
MELVLFVGLQASGKSTFFVERFLRTHVYLSLDVLRTRHREKRLFEACLETRTPVVIDNTNPRREDRRRYLEPARAASYEVHLYFFQSRLAECLARNERRQGKQKVPKAALLHTSRILEIPSRDEGFDRMWFVRPGETGEFAVEEWRDEDR